MHTWEHRWLGTVPLNRVSRVRYSESNVARWHLTWKPRRETISKDIARRNEQLLEIGIRSIELTAPCLYLHSVLLKLLGSKHLNEAVKLDTYNHDGLRCCANVRQVIRKEDHTFW